jgi:excisionase family DNA binding protein
MSDEFLTPQEAAALLGVPVSFIYERTRHDAIPLRRIGKYVRLPKSELLEWVNRGSAPSSAEALPETHDRTVDG